MKKTSNFNFLVISTLAISLFGGSILLAKSNNLTAATTGEEMKPTVTKKIFLALLLDTSNSMDGLIDQAKSQLWNIVDELADAQHEGADATLNIALYEYGNDNLSITSNFIRQLSPFTTDLDEISRQLFALKTNGGSEYCGAIIKTSLEDLEWGDDDKDLRLVFIAGNEPFNQGSIDYREACRDAEKKDIQINTIYCGNYQEGINTFWLEGAKIAKGEYMNIDMDKQTVFVATPYDTQIDQLNDDLNDTYLAYGKQGVVKKESQLREDGNAASYSQSNKVKRAISKSKHVYKNESWDLVDASKESGFDLSTIKEQDFPDEMKLMTTKEKEAYINEKSEKRKEIQDQIQQLAIQRKLYIKQVNDSLNVDNELEEAILKSVKTTARSKNFTFKKE